MMLIDGAVAAAAASVRQVATHGSLEETLAALARQHAVMFAGAFVAADDALGVQLQPVGARSRRVAVVVVTRRVRDRRDVGMLLLLRMLRRMMVTSLMKARRGRRLRSRVMVQLRRRGRRRTGAVHRLSRLQLPTR